jgi:hypothetical protein
MTYTDDLPLFRPVIRHGLSIRNAGKPYRSASNACRAKVANVHRPVRSPVSRARLHRRRSGNSTRGNRNAAASALHRLVLQTLDQLLRLLAAMVKCLAPVKSLIFDQYSATASASAPWPRLTPDQKHQRLRHNGTLRHFAGTTAQPFGVHCNTVADTGLSAVARSLLAAL